MPVEVGFRLAGSPQPLILVPARVNGVGPVPFILDTGAGSCLLSPALASRASVSVTSRETATGAGGRLDVDLGTAETLALGGAEVRDVPVAITDELSRIGQVVGAAIEGDVGYGFLRHFRLTIDYVRSRLTIFRGGEAPAGEAAPEEVPFRLAGEKEPLVLVSARIGSGGPFTFAVDTGASTTVVSRELGRDLGIANGRTARMLGGGGHVAGLWGALPTVEVGPTRSHNLGAVVGPFLGPLSEVVGTRLDGILGYNFLRQFRVTFDYPAERLGLFPA
ncbi:MAG TPA: aspartyl protease family protein [Thermoanaerobaculia bacterium]|nr:aspartyl protease family protein [Thermoanaerobaculia bacterium]